MKALLRALTMFAAAVPAFAQAPFNDSWERALPWGGTLHGGTTAGATADGSSSCDVGQSQDVWYVYTPEQNSLAQVYTRNGIDTVLSLHQLLPGQRLVTLACDDDGSPLSPPHGDSQLTWTAVVGTPYYLRVTGKNGQAGGFGIDFTTIIPREAMPANASRQTPLSIWPGDYHGYTRFGGTTSGCQIRGESAWFTYVPKTSGTVSLDTYSGTFFDLAIEVEENGVLIHCVDNDGGGESALFPVQAGAEYLIRLGSGTSEGSVGVYQMLLQGPECVGRTCDDPETIAEGTHLVSLVGAIPSGSTHCSSGLPGTEVGRYFRYVPPADGTLNVSTCGTTSTDVQGYAVDARLSLHSACPADTSTQIACASDSWLCSGGYGPEPLVSTAVVQGQEVLIRLAARSDGQLTPIQLEISLDQSALAMCFGDGSGSACPCGNAGAIQHGCDNSFGAGGARLFATGTASLSADTLSLVASDAPERAPILLLQGDAVAGAGSGMPFADGLMCVDGTMVRLAGAISAEGASVFGALDGASLSVLGGLPPPGSTRWYQGLYRNDKLFCTSVRANLKNAVRVTWGP